MILSRSGLSHHEAMMFRKQTCHFRKQSIQFNKQSADIF
jgi:hypothetical protein